MGGTKVVKKVSKTKKNKLRAPKKSLKAGAKRGGRVAGQKNKVRRFKIEKKWSRGLYKVLKQVHPDLQTTKKAMIIMNSVVNTVADKLYSELLGMSEHHQIKTLSDKDV